MIICRQFLVGLAASLFAAPAIVRATSLMPMRRVLVFPEPLHVCFAERLYAHFHLATIAQLQYSGRRTAGEITAKLNARGSRANNRRRWNAQNVDHVVALGERIKRPAMAAPMSRAVS
jgi:hypothetical protein